jgi:2,4-dienoyl-CoA reductase-like NADH-dependent reductase (Old Yellow Enzyme family)
MSLLFEPTKIGNFEIKNRFIRSATYYALSDTNGVISDANVDLMKTLAANEVGLIITGYAFVIKHGQVFPDMNGIDSDDHIAPLQGMTKAVHERDGKIVMQIAHGGSNSKWAAAGEGKYLTVSPVDEPMNDKRVPSEMTDGDIEEIIDAFGQSARRVQEAGFDGVQIHGAHGYLVTEFLSPRTNHRSDKWGGSLENRSRFLIEVIRSIKKSVDSDYPVMIKLGCRDYVPDDNALTIEDGAEVARMIEGEGICHIEVSHGTLDRTFNKGEAAVITPDREGYMLRDAKAVRGKTSIPIGLVGGMRSLPAMEEIIKSGACDHISICRPFIREPDLIAKYKRGVTETADCISCRGCFNADKNGKMDIYCSQLEKSR